MSLQLFGWFHRHAAQSTRSIEDSHHSWRLAAKSAMFWNKVWCKIEVFREALMSTTTVPPKCLDAASR